MLNRDKVPHYGRQMGVEPVIIHQARWVLPMEGPVIPDGAVAVRSGRIAAVGAAAEVRKTWELDHSRVLDHGDGAIIPALVNAHVHLEFTALRRAIAPQTNLPAWLQAAMAGFQTLSTSDMDRGVREGLAELRRFGTVLAAEVSTTGRSLPLLAASGQEFHYFYECLGFNLLGEAPLPDDFPFLAAAGPPSQPVSAAAHAPYSVSPALFRRIKDWNREKGRLTGIHLAESREEGQFFLRGDGPFRDLLTQRGRWYDDYRPPGCSPTVYLDRLGFWDERTLAVHGIWLAERDREVLARRRTWLALCPRSNLYTGAGFPDVPGLLRAGLNLALGTDSLASNQDLNLFQEIKAVQDRFPELQTAALLGLATRNGAAALHRDCDLGSIKPGKKAALLFLPVPAGTPLWPGLLEAGVQGRISWLTSQGKESGSDA